MDSRAAPVRPTPRSRDMRLLAGAGAAMNATMSVATAIASIVTIDAWGTAWAGLPAACAITGTGVGSVVLSRSMATHSRRAGLVTGYGIGLCGALAAAGAAQSSGVLASLALCLGMLVLGVGNASAQLSRYAAADLYAPEKRGAALGAIVWSAALGAVGGPLLLGPIAGAAGALHVSGTGAAMFVTAATCATALVLARRLPRRPPVARSVAVRARGLLRDPATRSPLAAMGAAQVAMVVVMTSTPVMMHNDGASLGSVGLMLSGHTLGMFALAPLSGRLVDRVGPRRVMVGGLVLLAVSCVGAGATDSMAGRMALLFLLGLAWNLCFVAGSVRIAVTVAPEQRISAEGAVDAAVWGAAAVAGLLSSLVLAESGYLMLTVFACAPILVPAGALLAERRSRRSDGAAVECAEPSV